MRGIDKLKAGDFNDMGQEPQADGSVIVTLRKRKEDVSYQFCVKDLYGPNENVLWEKEIGR